MGFGIMQDGNSAIIFLVLIFIGLMIYYFDKLPKNKYAYLFFGLLFGGAIGNLIDRVFFGFVRDFINFSFWPTFNVADAAIVIGGIAIIILLSRKKK